MDLFQTNTESVPTMDRGFLEIQALQMGQTVGNIQKAGAIFPTRSAIFPTSMYFFLTLALTSTGTFIVQHAYFTTHYNLASSSLSLVGALP